MRIEPLGDSGLLVRVMERFAGDESLDGVGRATRQLKRAQIPGILELVPAYTTVAIFFDPARIAGLDELSASIERTLKSDSESQHTPATASIIKVPVCYEDELAPDLDDVARQTGLSPEEIVRTHSAGNYRVSCVGFTPGFPYLSGLPPELAVRRRASPRKDVPAGAVAIGGMQTGIYPRKSPGGWNIIGRSPLRLFDVERYPPALFQTGDRVRFRRISRQEFDTLAT